MSISHNSDSTTYRISAVSTKTEKPKDDDNGFKSHYQQDGRYILIDSENGDRLNVSRLTAYAEYGEEIHERVVHHEIPILKVDAPRFLDVLPRAEHSRYEQQDPEPVEVDGFPVHQAEL